MKNLHVIGKELFITSDEEIKKDDYYLGDDNHIYCLCTTVNSNGKKIILTTNADYIEEGIQAIDDEFLEWFVNNPGCEEVEVMTDSYTMNQYFELKLKPDIFKYKIIIPKEESKQETLEQVAANLADPNICKTDNWIAGAKWQQERMLKFILDEDNYTEEELESSCIDVQTLVHFIEQFKKK